MEPVNIYINIIMGDVNNSSVVMSSDGSTAKVVPPDFIKELLEALRKSD